MKIVKMILQIDIRQNSLKRWEKEFYSKEINYCKRAFKTGEKVI